MQIISVIICLLFMSSSAFAYEAGKVYNGTSLKEVDLDQVLSGVQKGQAVLVSEQHGVVAHHEFQRTVIRQLIQKGHRVNMGIEHFSYLEQPAIDAYLNKTLPEAALVNTVKLSGFESWREQMLLPLTSGGWSYGLNAPRWLTGKINAVGYELLSDIEKQILPPDFTMGSAGYKKRMQDLMGIIHPTASFDKMFAAQSAWDDTSAWTLLRLMKNDPDSVFVVLFGDFHIAYQGGLPERLRGRGHTEAMTFSQVCLDGLTPLQMEQEMKPHADYGPRADYIVPAICQPK